MVKPFVQQGCFAKTNRCDLRRASSRLHARTCHCSGAEYVNAHQGEQQPKSLGSRDRFAQKKKSQ